MPTKALSCKKEAISEHGPEAPSCPVGQGSFKMDCFKLEKCSMVRRVQIWHFLFGNHRLRVLRAKEEGDLPACYQCSVQKPASLMVWGCISTYGMAACMFWKALWILKGIWRFWSSICSPPEDVYFREGLMYFSRTMQNHILQLLQQHGFIVEESGCWIGLLAVQIFYL